MIVRSVGHQYSSWAREATSVHSSTDKSQPGILNLCNTLVRTKKEQIAKVSDCVTMFIVQSTSSGFSRSASTPGGGSIAGCDITGMKRGAASDLDQRRLVNS
jgi:hypothetical protein